MIHEYVKSRGGGREKLNNLMITCCASEMTIQIELVGAHTLGGKSKHIM